MKQTIRFLDILDIQRKRSQTVSNQTTPKAHKQANNNNRLSTIKKNKYPFFKALNFTQQKFSDYPKWLTGRQQFMNFMYKNYQRKLLTIPKICQKQTRASDQKYFIMLYLQQIDLFKNLPSLIMECILQQIKTKKYQTNQIIHNQNNPMKFMAIIFIGSVQYTKNKKIYTKQRNQVVLTQAFYKTHHPTIIAKQQTVILYLNKSIYEKIKSQLKQELYEKNRAEISDMIKSDFFVQLHLKQKRAKNVYDLLSPQFYFKEQQICQAGQQANKFYLHFKGQVLQKNHIYIREHNKWPLPYNKWQVRAVYNSYQNQSSLKQYSFFGDQQIIGNYKFKSTYIAKSFCILFSMGQKQFREILTTEDLKRLKKYRNQHVNINYNQFESKVREKIKSQTEKKKIIHKAINTSFINKPNITPKKLQFLNCFQNSMLSQSKQMFEDKINEQNNFI